jgi:ankyrin repeat protein
MKYHYAIQYYYAAAVLSLTAFFIIPGCASGGSAVFSLLEKGKTQEAQALFAGKASLDQQDEQGRTPLHAAAEAGDAEMVRFLLALGAQPDTPDNQGRSPLGIAAARSDPEAIRLLSAAGADIYRPLSDGAAETPALIGVRSEGALLEALIHENTVNSKDQGGLTLFHLAGREGAAGSVRIIAAAGGRINEKDAEGKTALDYAFAETGSIRHARTAEKLVLAGGHSNHPFYEYFAPAARSSNYNIRVADGYTALHYAAREGYSGYIDFILEKNVDINIKNNSGATVLHEASRFGQLQIMEQLIDKGAEVDAQDAKGNSSLHLAAPVERHQQGIRILLSGGANPNLRDEHGETPLHVLITLGRPVEIIDALLEGGANVTSRNIEGKTVLYLAVEYHRTDLIPLFLSQGADIFAADNGGVTPLEAALKENNGAVLECLLTEETVIKSDSAGNTPLHLAVKNKAGAPIVGMILDKHAALNARNKEGNTALHIANMVNDEPAGTLLLSRGADIFAPNSQGENSLYLAFHSPGPVRQWMLTQKTMEAQDGLGNTALHYAGQWKLAGHIPLLIQKGAKLEAANATGETPLFWASRANSPETITALIAAGAMVNARDSLGNSALHCAVRWNAQSAIEPLMGAGISVDAQNLTGKSPLHEAVRLGLTSSENILINNRANIEIRDNQGNTPLMEAVQGGFPGAVERLAEAGADPISRNNTGDTPLHVAVTLRRTDLVTILLNNGAPIHARNSQGTTPFQIALSGSPAMVATLLTKDRILASDDDGLSPLHIAIKNRSDPAMLRAIIRGGGKISAVDSEGRTPLRLALELNAMEEAKILSDAGSNVFFPAADGKTPAAVALDKGEGAVRALFSGASVNALDGTGNTVLHYAAQTGKTDMIAILLELGANKNIRNIASESPAEIARRWNHEGAAAMLQ